MRLKRKLYSILQLDNRLFAKKDYAGFNRKGQEMLTSSRNKMAEDLSARVRNNKRILQEQINFDLVNNPHLSKEEIVKRNTEIYNKNNRALREQFRTKKLKAETDISIGSRKSWIGDGGKAIGDERKRVKDLTRKVMDKAYDGRDSKGIRLDLKKRTEAFKNKKAQNLQQGQLGNVKGGLKKLEADSQRLAQDKLSRNEAGINKGLVERLEKYKQKKAQAQQPIKGTTAPNDLISKTKTVVEKSKNSNIKAADKIKIDKGALDRYKANLKPAKWSKNAKIGAGIVAGTAVLGTGTYLYNKNKKAKTLN